MGHDARTSKPTRRAFLRGASLSGACVVAAGLVWPMRAAFAAAAPRWWERLDAARAVVGGATPFEIGIALDLPLLSEDGSNVPLTVSVDTPMNDTTYVREIHLFATRNPTPEIAAIRLTTTVDRAVVATRVRLGETQTVGAIAKLSDGTVRVVAREVRITTSGCFVRADAGTADEMTPRVRVPAKLAANKPAEIVTLISHPMETGLRPDATGKIIPQRIVKSFVASLDGAPLLEVDLFRSVAANPYFRFFLTPKRAGTIDFAWTEDTGRRATASAPFVIE